MLSTESCLSSNNSINKLYIFILNLYLTTSRTICRIEAWSRKLLQSCAKIYTIAVLELAMAKPKKPVNQRRVVTNTTAVMSSSVFS